MNQNKKIVVLGAGIAGVTTAIGVKKLGFEVTLIYKKRAFTAYEGFSQKTKDGFKLMSCENAFSILNEKSIRNSNWANISKSVNYEYVVCRDELDLALLEDAKKFDINIIEAKVQGVIEFEEKIEISFKKENEIFNLKADFLVDARGRFTPFKSEYIHGPKSFSILQELEILDLHQRQTSIDSCENGWVWQAYVGENKAYLQFTCDEDIAHKIKDFDDVLSYLENQDINLWSLKEYKTKNKIVKRDSYCKVHKEIVNEKMILVGDSASSIDPLSGNGAFQAMSMSSIAPYVINTILNDFINRDVAIKFYQQRVNYIFEKFSKVGKDFYEMEQRFNTSFWQARQTWPIFGKFDDCVRIEKSAIVVDGFIKEKEVVITKDNPLGAYFFGNLEIVNLVKYCLENKNPKEFVENFLKQFDSKFALALKKWLYEQNILIS